MHHGSGGGGGGEGVIGTPSLLFISEINLLCVDRTELPLQDDIPDFTIFFKSQEITEINAKSRENAYGCKRLCISAIC